MNVIINLLLADNLLIVILAVLAVKGKGERVAPRLTWDFSNKNPARKSMRDKSENLSVLPVPRPGTLRM